MSEQTAITDAKTLVGEVADQISEAQWEHAASDAHLPDRAGRLPGDPDWEPTFDPAWIAANAVELLAIRGLGEDGLQRFTSEGASFELREADLFGMARQLRRRSKVARLTGSGLGAIEVDGWLADYTPTSALRGGRARRVGGMLLPERQDWT